MYKDKKGGEYHPMNDAWSIWINSVYGTAVQQLNHGYEVEPKLSKKSRKIRQ